MATLPISDHIHWHRWKVATAVILAVFCVLSAIVTVRMELYSPFERSQAVEEQEERVLSNREKQELQEITHHPVVHEEVTAEDAKKLNENLPFSRAPIIAARSFVLPQTEANNAHLALKCLTEAIYYEAGFEPIEGRRAVAQVVLNRMRHPAFPKSVCGVVYEGATQPICQFSFSCDGSLLRAPQQAAWLAAQKIASAALHGRVEQSVGSATHYHANYVAPFWAPRLVKLAQIGTHIFYRWPGNWGKPSAFLGRYQGREMVPLVYMMSDNHQNIDQQTEALAMSKLPANLVPVRHSATDIGGRLDVSRGWTLKIPTPAETGSASSEALKRQNIDLASGGVTSTGAP